MDLKMDFQGLISILALIVAAMGAYYAREQVMLIRQAQLSTSRNVQTSPPVISEIPRFLRLKLYGPIAMLVVLVLLAWIPHFRHLPFPKWPEQYAPILVVG